jgi:mannose-6-phosphate isomerase-like protein (cupin superfamily)
MHKLLKKSDLPRGQSRTARFEGEPHGSEISFFFVDNDPGQGPALHVHPYSETWMVLSGEALFTADGEEIEAGEGDIVVASKGAPHKFRNTGSGPLQIMCVHASPRIIQEDLE